MAEPSAGDEPVVVDLRILCNATPTPISLPDLPATTTIGTLKTLVHEAIDFRPSVDRMRFIYLGRVIADDTRQLADIFGASNIQESREQNLHLVIPDNPRPNPSESSPTPAPRPATVPPNPFRQNSATAQAQPSPTNPFRAQNGTPRPGSQPPAGQPPHMAQHMAHHNLHHAHPPGFPMIMHGMPGLPPMAGHPPQMQGNLGAIINNQIQQAQAHAQAHAQALAQQHRQQGTGQNPGQPQQAQDTNSNGQATPPEATSGLRTPLNAFQQIIAQQQQQRAAAGAQGTGLGNSGEGPQASGNGSEQSGNRDGTTPPPLTGNNDSVRQPNNVTIVREGTGPNGAHWNFTIDSSVLVPGQPPIPIPNAPQASFAGLPLHSRPIIHQHQGQTAPQVPHIQELNALLETARRSAEEIEALTRLPLDSSSASGDRSRLVAQRLEHLRARARAVTANLDQMQARISPDLQSFRQQINSLRSTQQNVLTQLDRLAQSNQTSNARGTGSSGSSGSTTLPTSSIPTEASPSVGASSEPSQTQQNASPVPNVPSQSPSEVFLLSGPDGPYGLVFSNSGTYSTAPFVPSSAGVAINSMQSVQERLASIREQLQNSIQQQAFAQVVAGTGQQGIPAENGQQPQVPAQQEQAPQPGQDQAQQQLQNFARPAALLGHAWLAVRLLFFMYMLSGGPGWRRPLMIGAIAVAIYLGRLGVFNNQVDRARRHFENLLPLPEERRREQEQQRRAAGSQQPSPQDTAQRLVRERGDQTWTRIRDSLQMLERAVALFVASLWPGLGERMIAAREERLRQQREEEEQRQRDEEARRQAAEAKEEKEGEEANATSQSGEPSASSSVNKGKGKAKEEAVGDRPAESSQLLSEKAASPSQPHHNDTVD